MLRIRTLKPEHRQHRKVGPMTDQAYRLWVSMILEADDEGRLVCDASQLRAVTFAYHPRVSVAKVESAIRAIADSGMVRLYEVAGVRYAEFASWRDHQRIDKPSASKLPILNDSTNGRESSRTFENDMVGSGSDLDRKGSGTDRKKKLHDLCGLAPAAPSGVMGQNGSDPRPNAEESLPALGPPTLTGEESSPSARTPEQRFGPQANAEESLPAWPSPEQLVALYNRLAPQGLPKVTRLSPARRSKSLAYLRTFPERQFWTRAFSELKFSSFLLGHGRTPGREHFRGDFDWLLSKGKDGTENAVKVAEGKYRDGS